MKLIVAVLMSFLAGCVSLRTVAIEVANGAGELGDQGAELLRVECTEEYAAELGVARSSDEGARRAARRIVELDQVCLPMRDGLRGLRVAHVGLVAAIKLADASDDPSLLGPAIQKASAAIADVYKWVSAFGGRP